MGRVYPASRPFIEFRGVRYYREKQGWRCSACKGHERLARAVWRHHHGEIPADHYVACIDGDLWNNAIENLELRAKGASKEQMAAMRRMPRWGDEREQKLRSLHAMGISQNAIAAILRVPQGTIATKAKKLERGTRYFWTDERVTALRRMVTAGIGGPAIATELGCKPHMVYHQVHILGLRLGFWQDDKLQQLAALRAEGLSYAQVARRMGCDVMSAWKAYRRIMAAEPTA